LAGGPRRLCRRPRSLRSTSRRWSPESYVGASHSPLNRPRSPTCLRERTRIAGQYKGLRFRPFSLPLILRAGQVGGWLASSTTQIAELDKLTAPEVREDLSMSSTSTDRVDLPKRFPATPAALAVLTLALLQIDSRADKPADERAPYMIGYTTHRTDLSGGHFPNRVTSRAFVVNGDASGTRQLARELTRKPNQFAQFAGWSPDGRQAILNQGWESPENGAWEHKHGTFRFTAEHWLLDIILLDIESQKTTNLTAT